MAANRTTGRGKKGPLTGNQPHVPMDLHIEQLLLPVSITVTYSSFPKGARCAAPHRLSPTGSKAIVRDRALLHSSVVGLVLGVGC